MSNEAKAWEPASKQHGNMVSSMRSSHSQVSSNPKQQHYKGERDISSEEENKAEEIANFDESVSELSKNLNSIWRKHFGSKPPKKVVKRYQGHL